MRSSVLFLLAACSAFAQQPRLYTYYASPVTWGTPVLKAAGALGDASVSVSGILSSVIPSGSQFTLSAHVYTVTADAAAISGVATLPIIPALNASVPIGTGLSPWVWKSMVLDNLQISVDAAGQAHLSVPMPVFGQGFISTSTNEISIDTSWISFRSAVIPQELGVSPMPGQCQIGTGGWTADKRGLFYCIVNPDDTTRSIAPFVWSQPNRYSAPDPANPGQWIWKAIPQ